LAYATITNRNQRYLERYLAVYESYLRRGKKHWQAILRVAKRILRDVRRLAMEAQEAGPAPASWVFLRQAGAANINNP
jgi:hypothetical protein